MVNNPVYFINIPSSLSNFELNILRGDSGKKNHVGKKNQSIIFYFKFAAALFLCISVSDSHSAVFDVRNVKVSYFFHDLRPKQRVCRC
jgi:hypothetical protein